MLGECGGGAWKRLQRQSQASMVYTVQRKSVMGNGDISMGKKRDERCDGESSVRALPCAGCMRMRSGRCCSQSRTWATTTGTGTGTTVGSVRRGGRKE